MKSKPIDLLKFGELWDVNGDAVFERNLLQVFEHLDANDLLGDKKKGCIFLVSKIYYPEVGPPYRNIFERKGFISTLLRYYRLTFGKAFSKDDIFVYREKQSSKWENYEKEAQRRSAWGMYGATVRVQNEAREYEAIQKLPKEKRKEQLDRLKRKTNHLIIG